MTKTFSESQKHGQSALQDRVYALIIVLYTQTLAEDQIADTPEHAYTKNFRRHGGSHFQRNCDLTDSHPFLSVYPFDHDSADAFAIVFETSIPDVTYRLPCCGDVFPTDIDFSSSVCANVGSVVCFLILFSVDVFHEVVDVRDRGGSSILPP